MLVLYELHLTVLRDDCDKCCVPTVIYRQWVFYRRTSSRLKASAVPELNRVASLISFCFKDGRRPLLSVII